MDTKELLKWMENTKFYKFVTAVYIPDVDRHGK